MEKWGNAEHTIYHGDALEILERDIPDDSIDLIFADPPYNIGKKFNGSPDRWPTEKAYLDWSFNWLELCIRKLKGTGSLYVMTSTQAMPQFDIFLRDRLSSRESNMLIKQVFVMKPPAKG